MKWSAPKIWNDCGCWIIGGGYSISEQFGIPDTLVPEKMEEFKEYGKYLHPIHNKRVIGVNIAAFLGGFVDVAYWGDSDTYTDYKTEFNEYSGLKVSSAGKFDTLDTFRSIKYLHRNGTKGIVKNREEVSWVCRNSGGSAINLAYHLGAVRVFLLGFDMYHSPEGRMHWHTGYPDKSKTPKIKDVKQGKSIPRRVPVSDFKRHLKGWGIVEKDAKRLGIDIYNVNPKSKIDAFRKVNLKEAIELDNK